MKVNKTQAVIYMATLLVTNHQLRKQDVVSELELTDITFLRYIQEIRAFLANFYPYFELIYSRDKNEYRLLSQTRQGKI